MLRPAFLLSCAISRQGFVWGNYLFGVYLYICISVIYPPQFGQQGPWQLCPISIVFLKQEAQSFFYARVSTAHVLMCRGSFRFLFRSLLYIFYTFCQGPVLASLSLSELELILPEPASSSSDSVDTSSFDSVLLCPLCPTRVVMWVTYASFWNFVLGTSTTSRVRCPGAIVHPFGENQKFVPMIMIIRF